jgi:xylan 1,4-beta-xylosidase
VDRLESLTMRSPAVALFTLLLIGASASAADLRVDFATKQPKFRGLHGVNGGPLNHGGTVDVSVAWRELRVPITRLHDCEWPSGRVVDMHSLFPSLKADPTDAANYRFAETDDYLSAVTKATPRIVFRLGESIEHTPRKYHVHPPADYDAWAAACLGIIRHYNEGWANGFKHDIEYWEIWNEPENRPACWTGSDDDYYRLYATAAKAIKGRFPKLKVGGPAVGATGELQGDQWQPTDFLKGFLKHCADERVPLDFFSWHTYTDDPSLYRRKAKAIRAWLDETGFRETELHLNEWNYLPGNDWSPLSPAGQGERRAKWYEQQAGPQGAAFVACALLDMQDSPIDVANYFHGDASSFGLFAEHGELKKTYHAMRAFQTLLGTKHRVRASGSVPGELAIAAGIDSEGQAAIVLSNYRHTDKRFTIELSSLPWRGETVCEVRRVDKEQSLDKVESLTLVGDSLIINAPAPRVVVIRLKAK